MDIWTGGIRAYYGDFVWYDNMDDMMYTDWYYLEPNNDAFDENCMVLGWHNDGEWNDEQCYIKNQYVCEKNLLTV